MKKISFSQMVQPMLRVGFNGLWHNHINIDVISSSVIIRPPIIFPFHLYLFAEGDSIDDTHPSVKEQQTLQRDFINNENLSGEDSQGDFNEENLLEEDNNIDSEEDDSDLDDQENESDSDYEIEEGNESSDLLDDIDQSEEEENEIVLDDENLPEEDDGPIEEFPSQ